jgi:hypothetical protein
MQNHIETLRVLHTVYNNTLKPNTISIPAIKTQLYPHQATLIHGMHQYRAQMTQGMQVDADELRAKIGIVGDPSGSGKTLAILGYLASDLDPHPSFELTQYSSPYFYAQRQTHTLITSNLIIVPPHLFGYWEDEIKKHTNLNYVSIETRGKLKDELIQRILSSTFVLTTSKCYRHIQEFATRHHITWNNICIDEPLYIQLKSSDPQLQFQFLWFITHQWQHLLFRNPIKKAQLLFLNEPMHTDLEVMLLDNTTEDIYMFPSQYIKQYTIYSHSHRGHLVIRNANEHIRRDVPNEQHSIIQCKSTTTLQALSSISLARNASVRSYNIPHLFQALNIESIEPIEYIQMYPDKEVMIQRKVNENECGICFDSCTYPTMVTCCHHVYCGKCILQNTIIQFKCPTCREVLDIAHMKCLTDFGSSTLKTKKDACLDIIRTGTKCLIYISLDKIYHDLWPEIHAAGMHAELITSFSLRKAVKNFKEGNTTVLFISKIELLRGIGISAISSLLFYHEPSVFELKQTLINTAQQMGRCQPLQIIHLHSEIQV